MLNLVIEQRERADRLGMLADRLEENAACDELSALLGRDAQLRLEDRDPRLRGQRLREVAVEIFLAQVHRADGVESIGQRTARFQVVA